MFWYNGPNIDHTELEIVVTDLNPTHSHIVIGPHSDTTIDDLDAVAQAAYIGALQRSGLCVPTSVFCEHGQFYAQLTESAAQNPLDAFSCLVQLHPSCAG